MDGLSSQTALFYSSREGHTEMCKLLMDVDNVIYHRMAVNHRIKINQGKQHCFMLKKLTRRTLSIS